MIPNFIQDKKVSIYLSISGWRDFHHYHSPPITSIPLRSLFLDGVVATIFSILCSSAFKRSSITTNIMTEVCNDALKRRHPEPWVSKDPQKYTQRLANPPISLGLGEVCVGGWDAKCTKGVLGAIAAANTVCLKNVQFLIKGSIKSFLQTHTKQVRACSPRPRVTLLQTHMFMFSMRGVGWNRSFKSVRAHVCACLCVRVYHSLICSCVPDVSARPLEYSIA